MKKATERIDKLIVYNCDEFGEVLTPIKCVMCGELALYVVFDTNEPLCQKCKLNNDEARLKK